MKPILALSLGLLLLGAALAADDEQPNDPPAEQKTLAQELAELRERAQGRQTDEVRRIFDAAAKQLRESGLVEHALKVGAQAPRFELPDATGEKVTLDAALAAGPVVVTFYRGGWCPYCNLALRALQRELPAIQAAGGRLLAISPEQPDHVVTTTEKLQLGFTVLSDHGNEVARRFGLAFKLPDELRDLYQQFGVDLPKTNGYDAWELPVPATFVLDKDGVVRWAFVDTDYTKRAEPADIVKALQALQAPAAPGE